MGALVSKPVAIRWFGLLLAFLALQGHAEAVLQPGLTVPARPVLTVGYVEFPPYEYTDALGRPAGSYIELTRLVAEQAGMTPQFQALPIGRVYLYLQEGKIDLWPGLRGVPRLAKHVLESQSEPVRIRLYAYHLPHSPAIEGVAGFRGKIVILITGYTYAGLLNQLVARDSGVLATFTSTHEAALKMLEKQRGHYLLDYGDPVEETLRSYPVADLQRSPILDQAGAFVMSAAVPKAQARLDALDKAYRELLSAGWISTLGKPPE